MMEKIDLGAVAGALKSAGGEPEEIKLLEGPLLAELQNYTLRHGPEAAAFHLGSKAANALIVLRRDRHFAAVNRGEGR